VMLSLVPGMSDSLHLHESIFSLIWFEKCCGSSNSSYSYILYNYSCKKYCFTISYFLSFVVVTLTS
jgi:hypothetical protein